MRQVLVVDDEPLIADTLTAIFRRSGYAVRTAYSADQALALAHEITPHLLICDIDMPVRDGLALMADFGREIPTCPILVLTGLYNSLKRIRDTANHLAAPVHILTKPCQPAELLREASAMIAPTP
jgi:CheY-like chemotaxis protein